MKTDDLQIFIDGATDFFDINLGKGKIQVGKPSLQKSANSTFYEYTGVINIFGDKVGRIYFSSPMSLITHLLEAMGEKNIDDDLIADVVGEIANSIAGNAREHYGSGFCLSIPTVLKEGEVDAQVIQAFESYVIPLNWNGSRSSVAVWFE